MSSFSSYSSSVIGKLRCSMCTHITCRQARGRSFAVQEAAAREWGQEARRGGGRRGEAAHRRSSIQADCSCSIHQW